MGIMNEAESSNPKVTPWRCLLGATVSGTIAVAIYWLMRAIATALTNHPITFTNPIAINLAIAVRTLIVGLTALGAGVFGFVALGLILLALQLIIQKLTRKQET